MAIAFSLSAVSVSGAPGVAVAQAQMNGIGPCRLVIKNTGANALTAARVKLGPDLTTMAVLDSSTFASLAAGAVAQLAIAAPVDGIRVELESTSGTTVTVALEDA